MEGGKEAFCLLLWTANGGCITSQGGLDQKVWVRGVCANPFDCFQCILMQAELAQYQPGQVLWVCPGCVKDVVNDAKQKDLPFHLPGHFTEGQCQSPGCTRPARVEDGVELPIRYSRFLQLFITSKI